MNENKWPRLNKKQLCLKKKRKREREAKTFFQYLCLKCFTLRNLSASNVPKSISNSANMIRFTGFFIQWRSRCGRFGQL